MTVSTKQVPHADIFFEYVFNRYTVCFLENGGSDFFNFIGLDLSDETIKRIREIYENGDIPNNEIYGYHVGASIMLPPGTSVETLWDDTPSAQNPLFVGDSVFYRDTTDTVPYMSATDLDIFDPTEAIPLNTAHYFWVYVLKLGELLLRVTEFGTDDPVQVDGFSVGSMCNFDFECETGAECDKHNFCSFP